MAKILKICMLTDDPSPIGGGPEHIRHVSQILRSKYQFQVKIVSPVSMDPKFDISKFANRINC